jgi:hypothetical protein
MGPQQQIVRLTHELILTESDGYAFYLYLSLPGKGESIRESTPD